MPVVNSFHVGGAPVTNVRVTGLTATEELTSPYTCTVSLLADALDPDSYIDQPCHLAFEHLGQQRVFTGIIVAVSFVGTGSSAVQMASDEARFAWSLTLAPRLALLGYTTHSQVFATTKPKTAIDLVTDMLATAMDGQTIDCDTAGIGDKAAYPAFDMSIQYQESDLDYVLRTAERAGIGFYFTVPESATAPYAERVCLFDNNDALPPFPMQAGALPGLYYRPADGNDTQPAVRSAGLRLALSPAKASVTDYDYRIGKLDPPNPAVSGTGSSGSYAFGAVQEVDLHPVELHAQGGAEAAGGAWTSRWAQVLADRGAMGQAMLHGTTDAAALAPGMVFNLVLEPGRTATNPPGLVADEYVVLSVTHRAAFSTMGSGGGTYLNEFTAMPARFAYRPPCRTKAPVIAGVVLAQVDPTPVSGSDPPQRSQMDTLGCYRLKFAFDQRQGQASGQPSQGGWSAPVRMATAHHGPLNARNEPTGMIFPLLPGTRVLVAFVGGNPDRPVIMGPAYDAVNKAVVSSAAATTNVLRTTSGLVMKMLDGPAGKA